MKRTWCALGSPDTLIQVDIFFFGATFCENIISKYLLQTAHDFSQKADKEYPPNFKPEYRSWPPHQHNYVTLDITSHWASIIQTYKEHNKVGWLNKWMLQLELHTWYKVYTLFLSPSIFNTSSENYNRSVLNSMNEGSSDKGWYTKKGKKGTKKIAVVQWERASCISLIMMRVTQWLCNGLKSLGNSKRKLGSTKFSICSFYSHANFVSKLLKQMAKAWKADKGYR